MRRRSALAPLIFRGFSHMWWRLPHTNVTMTRGEAGVLNSARYEMAWMTKAIKAGVHVDQIGDFWA